MSLPKRSAMGSESSLTYLKADSPSPEEAQGTLPRLTKANDRTAQLSTALPPDPPKTYEAPYKGCTVRTCTEFPQMLRSA